MITPLSLEFENAGSYRKCKIDLEDQGVVFVKGENLDLVQEDSDKSSDKLSKVLCSNGAGKSIPWGILKHIIYGVTDRGLKKNQILTLLPESDGYFGQWIFRKDGKKFMVRQARGHSKYGTGVFVFERDPDDTKWINITPKLAKDAQSFVSDTLVGLSLYEWDGCVFLSHGMAHILIEGLGTERKNYLSSLFQLDRYDVLGKYTKDALEVVETNLSSLLVIESKITELTSRMSELPSVEQLNTIISSNQFADKYASKKISEQKEIIEQCKLELQDLERRNTLVNQILELGYTEDDRDSVLTKQKEHKAQYIELTKERDSVTVTISTLDQKAAIQSELDLIPDIVKQSNVKHITELLKEYQVKNNELVSLKSSLDKRARLQSKLIALSSDALDPVKLQQEESDLRSKLAVTSFTITKSKEEISVLRDLVSKNQCPTCKSNIDAVTINRLISASEATLSDAEKDKTNIKVRLADITPLLQKIDEINSIQAQINDLPTSSLEEVNAELEQLKLDIQETTKQKEQVVNFISLKKRLSDLPNVEFNKPTLQKQLKIVNAQLENLEQDRAKVKEVAVLFNQLDGIPFRSESAIRKRLTIAEETYSILTDAIKTISATLATAQNQLDVLNKYKQDLDIANADLVTLPELKAKQRRLSVLKKAIPALKTRHLHNITLAIQEILPRYTSLMFSEKGLTFSVDESDDSIDIFAKRSHVNENGDTTQILLPVKSLSNGEKKRLSVSFLFTLHDLLSPSKMIDLLVLDEVDGGLDGDGLDCLMSLIEEKKTKYGTIVMISHREAIASARFDRTWIARKRNHESTFISQNSVEVQ